MYNVIEAKHPLQDAWPLCCFSFFALTVVISTTGASLEAVACDVTIAIDAVITVKGGITFVGECRFSRVRTCFERVSS